MSAVAWELAELYAGAGRLVALLYQAWVSCIDQRSQSGIRSGEPVKVSKGLRWLSPYTLVVLMGGHNGPRKMCDWRDTPGWLIFGSYLTRSWRKFGI